MATATSVLYDEPLDGSTCFALGTSIINLLQGLNEREEETLTEADVEILRYMTITMVNAMRVASWKIRVVKSLIHFILGICFHYFFLSLWSASIVYFLDYTMTGSNCECDAINLILWAAMIGTLVQLIVSICFKFLLFVDFQRGYRESFSEHGNVDDCPRSLIIKSFLTSSSCFAIPTEEEACMDHLCKFFGLGRMAKNSEINAKFRKAIGSHLDENGNLNFENKKLIKNCIYMEAIMIFRGQY